MKSGLSVVALAVSFIAVSASSRATCTQANLAGKWGVYVQSNGTNNYAIACEVVINAKGAISASNSGCAATNGASSPVNGSLLLKSGSQCNYAGTVTLTAFGLKQTFLRSTLTPDRGTLMGVGYEPASGVGYIFTMARMP